MKKILFLISGFLLFVVIGTGLIRVNAFSTVTFDVVSYFDEYNTTTTTITDANYGDTLSLDTALGSQSGYTFMYWIINGVVEMNSAVNAQFPVVEGMSVNALFSPDTAHLAVFMDSNGRFLDLDYVTDGGTAVADGGFTEPTKPGYSVTAEKWDKPLTNILSDTVFVLQYEKTSVETYTLTVNNGTGGGTYDFNTEVTVVADAPPGGQVFNHWEDGGGNVISISPTYTLTVLGNRTITAVYDVSPHSDVPVLANQPLMLRDGYHSYLSQTYVPSGDTLIEYGVITSVSEQSPTLDIDHNDHIYRSSLMNSNTDEYLSSIPMNHFYARSYMVTKDSEGLITTTYSQIVSYNSTKNPMVLDFEDESKTSYAAGTVNIDGNDWYLDTALIGNQTGDLKYDTKSLRFDDLGSITSEFPFASGIDSIHFLYGLYSGAPAADIAVQYAYAWDPNNWISVEIAPSDYDLTVDNTSLQAITVDLNVNAAVYLRIVKLTGTDRLNIDNIIINSAEYSDSSNPIILGYTNATITEGDTYDPTTGVRALDFYDGDLTGDILAVTKDSGENVITPGDYSGLSAGSYTVELSVTDSNSNVGTATINLTINPDIGLVWITENLDDYDGVTNTYATGTFTGVNSILWSYDGARRFTDDSSYTIGGSGTSMMFGSGIGSVSGDIDNGIGSFSLDILSGYTSGSASDRSIEVFVNSTSVGTYTLNAMGVVETLTISDINVSGTFNLEIRNIGTKQIVIDNIEWTAYPPA